MTPVETTAPLPAQTTGAPAATNQPGAAGTPGAPGSCSANIQSDAANCGGCGYACPANALCQQGQCYCKEGYTAENNACVAAPAGGAGTTTGCPAGMSPCPDGYCYELSSSPDNCGICGNTCPAGMICSASTCTNVPTEATTVAVTTGTTTATVTSTVSSTSTLGVIGTGFIYIKCPVKGDVRCDGTCVNLSTSTTNCGECGKVCKSLAPTCCKGGCVNTMTDNNNCGSCGHKCMFGITCVAGSCKTKVVVGPTAVKIPTYAIVKPIYQIPVDPFGPANPGF